MTSRKSTNTNSKPFKRTTGMKIIWRYVVVSTFIVLFAAWIVRAMIYTTVVDRDRWVKKANEELQRRDTILPARGEILAADGSVLATNLNYYTLRIDFAATKFSDKMFMESLDSLVDTLALHHPVRNREQWREYLTAPLSKPREKRSHTFTLLRDLTYSQAMEVSNYPYFRRSKNPNRTGLTIENKLKRSYPYGAMARRSIGRTGQTKDSRHVHGISGLEYALDAMLYGKPGLAKKVPLTHNIVNWTDVPPVDGYTVTTTIDIALQDILENELNKKLLETEAEWGTAILMEVKTGDIKAISNLERDSTGNYIEAMNRAVMRYEPGSVIKTVSMVIALEDGLVKNLDEVYETDPWVFRGNRIKEDHETKRLPVRRFLECSSNVGMSKLIVPHFAGDLNSFRDRILELGLGDSFKTGIAGEAPMWFPTLNPKEGGLSSLCRQPWGYCTMISPLYVCAFYNAVANDGKFVKPRLVSKIRTEHGDSIIPVTYVRDKICSPENARIVREMLRQVILGEGGTARVLRKSRINIAGKTGTALIAKEMSPEDQAKLKLNPNDSTVKRPRGYIDGDRGARRFAFCGFFPYENPKYTCMVVICRPKKYVVRNAGVISGTVLQNVAERMYSRGMLGAGPDFRDNAPADAVPMTIHATNNSVRDSRIRTIAGNNASGSRRLRTPAATPEGTVPDVVGLSLREAIVTLEQRGYELTFTGSGAVVTQNPPPGTYLTKGARIELTLSNSQ